MKRRGTEGGRGKRPTGKIDKFDEAPLFRAGRVVLSAAPVSSIYISLFFFLLLTKDEAPLCTIKSLMSEDVADVAGGLDGWARGRKPVTRRGAGGGGEGG